MNGKAVSAIKLSSEVLLVAASYSAFHDAACRRLGVQKSWHFVVITVEHTISWRRSPQQTSTFPTLLK